ncbi:hypothetical protein OPV22_020794 [Ensete ventricosum]|uniref:Uncharacterized protein n=1 Tax=Ensete ventricosum TaxID=4639 RepID=A0AAV8QP47_ENSVE|nr:hypothetical protein OPV22_020794 [Ensete ventricosum]
MAHGKAAPAVQASFLAGNPQGTLSSRDSKKLRGRVLYQQWVFVDAGNLIRLEVSHKFRQCLLRTSTREEALVHASVERCSFFSVILQPVFHSLQEKRVDYCSSHFVTSNNPASQLVGRHQ